MSNSSLTKTDDVVAAAPPCLRVFWWGAGAGCRPATPQHKGKVEQGGVHYVKRNFLAGREPTLLTQANQAVRTWCTTTAGLQMHGTTREQPLVRFAQTEQGQFQPLPTAPYDLAIWCDFVRQHHNLLIYGPTGTGKTHLAQALVHEACRQGFDALFTTTAKLLQTLNGGRADGTFERRFQAFLRPDLVGA